VGQAHTVLAIGFLRGTCLRQREGALDITLVGGDEGQITVRPDERIEFGIAGERDRLLAVALTFFQAAEGPGAAPRPGQQHRQSGVARAARVIDDLGEPTRRFLAQAEAAHIAYIGRDPSGDVDVRMFDGPTEGGPQIVDLALEPAMRHALPRAAPDPEMRVRIRDKKFSVAPPSGLGFPRCSKLLFGELADRFEEAVAHRLAGPLAGDQ
jgi:hypothetical protein